jgi:CBS domain-containing protein
MANPVFTSEIYSKDFNSVKESDSISRCLESFKTGLPPVLAVLDEKGKYVGMITRRSILRSKLSPKESKVKALMKAAPRVAPDFSATKLAKLMIESGIRQLPVFEKEKLLGFVTGENIIHAAVLQEWGNTPVEKIMSKSPYTIEGNRSVGAVLGIMREHGVSHVPVLENGKLVGMVSIQDILTNVFWPDKHQTHGDIVGEKMEKLGISVKGIMAKPVVTVQPETPLKVAEKKMHEFDISCLAVTSNDRLVGIVTKLDFLEPISQLEVQKGKFTIQFGIKGADITPEQQSFMMSEFDSFTRKYQDAFQSGTLFVYLKTHGSTNTRESPLVHCRLQLRTARGTFFSSGEGWGTEPTFRVALDRLERRVLRSKEMIGYNPKYARDYMRKIWSPSDEE